MSQNKAALELKGRLLSVTRVKVIDPAPDKVKAQLQKFARQMGAAAEGLPVVLDAEVPVEIDALLSALRAASLQPVAVVEGALSAVGVAAGLAVLPADVFIDSAAASPGRSGGSRPQEPPAPSAAPTVVRKPARIIHEPVRSGRQVYAEGSDLIVMSTVSEGAEVIADGCVHVYGTMRGRAIAGATGDTGARVFCMRMQAELLAVAGIYAVADQLKPELLRKPVQAWLQDGRLHVERLEI